MATKHCFLVAKWRLVVACLPLLAVTRLGQPHPEQGPMMAGNALGRQTKTLCELELQFLNSLSPTRGQLQTCGALYATVGPVQSSSVSAHGMAIAHFSSKGTWQSTTSPKPLGLSSPCLQESGRLASMSLAGNSNGQVSGSEPTFGNSEGQSATKPILVSCETTIAGEHWKYRMLAARGAACDEALLLLTGGFGEAGTEVAEFMSALSNRDRIIVVDYPAIADLKELTSGIECILEINGIRRVDVFGASYGGTIAQCLVRKMPKSVNCVVLSNTSTPLPWAHPLTSVAANAFSVLPEDVVLDVFRSYAIRNIIRPSSEEERKAANLFFERQIASGFGKRELLATLTIMSQFHTLEFTPDDLRQWPGRILIIESDDDPGVPLPAQKQLRELYPQAQVHTFHGGGHVPAMKFREDYLRIVKEFVEAS